MAEIRLNKGAIALVDDEDYERVVAVGGWYLHTKGYVIRNHQSENRRSTVRLHRFVLGLLPKDLQHVDHANGDKLDNRRSNLRICTRSQNMHNRKVDRSNSSGVKGVFWHRQHSKWYARIGLHGKSIFLGLFDDLKDAECAVRKARERLHGEFARHE